MEEDIQKLLSGLYTDALLALDDTWDRSDEGFKAQIQLIEKFGAEHDIEIIDGREDFSLNYEINS